MTRTQRAANTTMIYARNTSEQMLREFGIFTSPVAEMKKWAMLAGPRFGYTNITADMTDTEVVAQFEKDMGEKLTVTTDDDKLVVVRAAEKWELASHDAYHAIMDPAEVEAQAAYDKVFAETEDEDAASEAYNAIYDEAEEKAQKAANKAEAKALEEELDEEGAA